MPDDTIYAISSGRPPAAIAIMRISGARAGAVLARIAGGLPEERLATLRSLRSSTGELLDRALVLWFPAPNSATGEDVVELHLHGGIAVVAAVSRSLAAMGLRHAEAGEFTRRAVFNGRLDLNEAEGLGDLLAAETETQRREALLRATGALGRELDAWTRRLLAIAASAEQAIDYEGEDAPTESLLADDLARLHDDIARALARPPAERLRDGVRIAIVGPVNAGKSSLFNALVGSDAAIVTPMAGTTRDLLERPIALHGIPFVMMDTAGLRETNDAVEKIGIDRAMDADRAADIVLDLSETAQTGGKRIAITAKADVTAHRAGTLSLSALTGSGLGDLVLTICNKAAQMLPAEGDFALNRRQRDALEAARLDLEAAMSCRDVLLVAHHVAAARRRFDILTGRAGIEDLLDSLFARFCLGK